MTKTETVEEWQAQYPDRKWGWEKSYPTEVEAVTSLWWMGESPAPITRFRTVTTIRTEWSQE